MVTVKVDLVSGGGSLILPGDRVDVMVHLVKDLTHDVPETVTRTFLQDIKVFAVNDVFGLESQKDGSKSIIAKTISLLVTPEQAAKVMLASQLGNVQLMMRGIEEEKQSPNAQAKPSDLFGVVSKGEPEKEGPADPHETKDKGFVDFLNSMKTKPAADAAAAPKARATWTMRVLKPGTVEDVQFEAEEGTAGNGSPSSGWKIMAAGSAGGGPEAKAEPPGADPPAPPPQSKPEPKPKDKAGKA